MSIRLRAFALSLIFSMLPLLSSLAATLGPAETISDLRAMLEEAASGDILLIAGEVSMDNGAPLTSEIPVHITSQSGETAILRALRLQDASITFSNIAFENSLLISGTSSILLSRSVSVRGTDGKSGLSFHGNGSLILEPGCKVEGGRGGAGVSISHSGGEFYTSIEGSVLGGSGTSGGPGVLISPLRDSSAVLISGSIQGGSGTSLGGHALNLYNLSGNAFVTVSGSLQGGSGSIGGDGIQLVSASDSVNVGVSAKVKGGTGDSYGGNALILMNAEDSSSFNLSGSFSGGDASGEGAQPGTSLHLVGESAAVRARIDNCMLEDGRRLAPVAIATPSFESEITPEPTPEPTPQPTPEHDAKPEVTPLPEITAPAEDVAFIITPEPPSEHAPIPEDSSSSSQ